MKLLTGIVFIVGLLILIVFIFGPEEQVGTATSTHSEPEQSDRAAAKCDHGSPITGSFYVKGSDVNFRMGPGIEHARVVNQKATDIHGSTQHRTLWPSMVLEGLCETTEWLRARIVKANGSPVKWETGWVHKRFVASDASDDMKIGLLWDIDGEAEFSDAEKQILRRGALQVLQHEANCAEITTGYRSGSRQGAYYVTCNARNGGPPFNVWFTPDEVNTGRTLAVPEAYPEAVSRRACERAITERVVHPSTLDVHHFIGYATTVHNNGSRTLIQEFSAKNSFGLELEYRARCLIQPDGALEITISEVN